MIPVGSLNSTQSSMSMTIGSSVGLSMIVTILLICACIGFLLVLASDLKRYTKFFTAIGKWISTLKYTLYGTGFVGKSVV